MRNQSLFALAFFGLLTATLLFSFQKPTIPDMTNFPPGDFLKEWKKIDSLENRGLPKSALEEVEKLYVRAKAENNPSQIIKSLIYRGKYESQLEEDGYPKAINKLEAETKTAQFPTKEILHSMLGEMYAQYADQNYWRFQNRTETLEFKNEDLQTWTLSQIIDRANEHFAASVKNTKTQTVPIENFDVISSTGFNDQKVRPLLYDFLAFRAIDHFKNDRHYLTEPSYKFYLDDDRALAAADVFASAKFETKDSNSRKYQTLLLFQEVLNFHKKDKNPEALIDADLKRLEWIYENAIIDIKEDLYEKALKDLFSKYQNVEASAEISHQLAKFYFQRGNKYKPTPHYLQNETKPVINSSDPEFTKWDYKTAYDLCEKAVKSHPKSIGASHCNALQLQITQQELRVEMEKVYLPNKPILAKLTYRNFDKAYFKLIQLDEKTKEKIDETGWNEKVAFFNTLPFINNWTESLPNDGDYRSHSVEFQCGARPAGQYLLLTSDNENFSDQAGKVNSVFFQTSTIAYIKTTGRNLGKLNFIAVDRNEGNPLVGVKGEFYTNDYSRLTGKSNVKKMASATSDENGEIAPGIDKRGSYMAKFRYKNELLLSENWYGNYPNDSKPRIRRQAHFFLDRAIYRPGQTVYFKVLAVEYGTDQMPSILKNHPVSVTLKDANYQDVKELELTTNEYGTVSGTFTAPKGGLLGRMTLNSIGGAQIGFRVEEYKRPKFEVNFKPIEESYRLGEKVNLTGAAKAYAGNNIDGAEVTYRVVREVRFPYWNWRWGWWNPWRGTSMEVTNGKTTTDEKGDFKIEFTALPDRSIPKERQPEFYYKVMADVTDITGETQSGSTNVRAGYVALELKVSVPENLNLDIENQLVINSKNLNNFPEKADIEVTLEALNVPEKIFKKRYWDKADRTIISQGEFSKDFPEFAFGNEEEKESWSSGQAKIIKKGTIEGEEKLTLTPAPQQAVAPLITKPGVYRLTAKTADKYGAPIEVVKYFTAYKSGAKKPPVPSVIWSGNWSQTYEPGQTAEMQFASSHENLCIYGNLENRSTSLRQGWLNCTGGESVKHPVTEADRGGMGMTTFAVKNNRYYQNRTTINVPWSNKDLAIEYGTFRDKLKPGSDEEWIIKITGNKKDKVTAEFVAAMYDASLDAFAPNQWAFSPFPSYYTRSNWSTDNFQSINGQEWNRYRGGESALILNRTYRQLNWFNWYFNSNDVYMRGSRAGSTFYMVDGISVQGNLQPEAEMAAPQTAEPTMAGAPRRAMKSMAAAPAGVSADADEVQVVRNEANIDGEAIEEETKEDIPVRSNLNETVFFFPNLMTDEEGNVLIKFKMNEALTKWKFLGMAHTTDLQTAVTENYVVTQKELMVQPNPPRFFREGDRIEYTAKVSNLTENEMNGTAQLLLFDALTDEPIDVLLGNKNASINFSAKAGQSDRLAWVINIPVGGVQAIKHRVIAKAGKFSDGEEAVAPVLTNRMMVTESMPLPVRGGESKTFTFKKLKNNTSKTLTNHSLTLEYTSNPAWYAVQSLPYLMEYPYECTEQIASRFYANSLATHVSNSSPKVKQIFDRWRDYEPEALKSNLSKNQELKTALLEETPWVLDAQAEEMQKKNIALLFDLNRMSYEQDATLRKLADRQEGNGGWSWFPGGRPSWYITQHVVTSIGHLQRLGVRPMEQNEKYRTMIEKAVRYCDFQMLEEYKELERRGITDAKIWESDRLGSMIIHYLYMRSFFISPNLNQAGNKENWRDAKGIGMDKNTQKAFNFYLGQAEKYWLNKGIYQQGMIALGLDRVGGSKQPADIVKSLKERSLNNEELGMYWKYNRGYFWYQAPIETHALMIEVFRDVAEDNQSVDDLKVWLLKNKQTNNWKTTKATAAAVYALLMSGDDWLLEDEPVKISFPNSKDSKFEKDIVAAQSGAEAGTGYFKVRLDGKEVNSDLSTVNVNNSNKVVSWGSLYWQYFENLDKITTFEETPLTIKKQVFRVELSDTGEKIRPVSKTDLNVGDKLKVRIELRVDRDMEYVHMKDMRASGFEPMNVLSQYKWQGGLGYYESTRDASTNFFFDRLPKGTYVFEYPLRVVHNGDFSNGITTVQCMYAPEFSSHSEGERFEIEGE